MITAPKECPSDAKLLRIIAAIRVIYGVDLFIHRWATSRRGSEDLSAIKKNYVAFSLWVAVNYGELSKYADAGVKDQSNAGQIVEGDQGDMVLQPTSGAVW